MELVRSADSATAKPDGNFGDLGITNTSGYTTIAGLTVTLQNSIPGAIFGQYGYHNELLVKLPAGLTLPADYYRVYLPNNAQSPITDIYGNQLDGEFLGYQSASGKYVDQLQTGQVRGAGSSELPDLSGDGTPGGAFMTGFVVVPNGNIIYTAADAIYNPQIPSQTPNGSQARPYPVLAPEAVPTQANGGDLNSVVNSGTNFDKTYDRSGDGQFEPSAFFAAQQRVQATDGPVVILAEQSVPTFDPTTGQIIQKPFVLQAPNPSGNQAASVANDASAAVPAMTTLEFGPGTIVKMQNAAILVQNQGSALQIDGGANSYQRVVITSYKDSSVGGVSNGDPNSVPQPGDYGGILFRNFSQAALPGQTAARNNLFPGQIPITGNATQDQRLKGPFADPSNPASQVDAISGADDIMSSVSFLLEKYAGGAVPATIGTRYDGITLVNSRPEVVNSTITSAGGSGGSEAGLSVDVDALRADDVAQGPLIRNDQFINNGLNGIYVRAEVGSGVAEATNSISYPANPSNRGGTANYVFNDPYPYLLTSRLAVGQQLSVDTGSFASTNDRLDIEPGMLVKFEQGASIEVGVGLQNFGFGNNLASSASLVVGDPTYMNEYDLNHLVGPTFAATLPNGKPNPQAGQTDPSFRPNSALLAKVIFTSFNDNAATTSYFDPVTQTTTTIVQPLDVLPTSAITPAPAKADWGGIQLDAGSRDTINSAVFRYGGGLVNTDQTTTRRHAIDINPGDDIGAFLSITNNLFLDNADVPINTSPNALLATDASRPLNSGAPFIHGNLFTGNDYNAVGVTGGTTSFNDSNLDVNSVWAGSDFTYLLRATIVLGPTGGIGHFPIGIPSTFGNTLQPEPTPNVVLTLQSTLAGTVLADGTVVPAPGIPLIVKLQNPILPNGQPDPALAPQAPSNGAVPTAAAKNSYSQGAGFVVGVDNGIDPTADALIDPGAYSQIRIVGIGANQTTGQSRVPVIITSIHDNTVGTTINGVQMNQVVANDTTAPKAGDGGVIYFGANSLTDYNLLDPRDGSLIDNADIKYITRIEQQGGGLVYAFDQLGKNAFTPSYEQLYGLPLTPGDTASGINFAAQYNAPKQLTVSDSNLSSFSDIGFFAHPGYGSILNQQNYTHTVQFIRNTGFLGEPTHDFFVNDTFTNMPTGVEVISENATDSVETNAPNMGPYPAPEVAIFLNDTFYNNTNLIPNGVAIHTIAPVGTGANFESHVALLAMDSIFDGFGTAVETDGQTFGGTQNEGQNNVVTIIPGQLQYNLFFGNTNNVGGTQPVPIGPMFTGDPQFRDANGGNFFLLPNSPAIDRARSELGPTIFGDTLFPMVNVDQNNLSATPIRNEPVATGGNVGGGFFGIGVLDQSQPAGDVDFTGGLGYESPYYVGTQYLVPYNVDYVTLPGEPYSGNTTGSASTRTFPDQFIPVLQSSGTGTTGTAADQSTFAYEPVVGERDQAGNLRMKDPNSTNIGFGSRIGFDLGAFEYIIQNPPLVDAVNATTTSGTTNIYGVGTVAGTNKLPTSIQIKFNERLDPTTLTGMSVLLQASGGDGIFGNGNSPLDRSIDLSGKLSFDPSTDTLTIDTSGIFTSAASANDEYRVILKGTGSSVIRDNSGLALDGDNLDPNGNQLPLPSGVDQFPGSDFSVTFTIDTNPPALVPGSFILDPASDTSGGRNITKNNLPTFDGKVLDVFPPVNFLQGQRVQIDISTKGDGVFDLLDAGQGVTDINGNFRITLTRAIPDTPGTIGAGGIQGASGAIYTLVRVRVTDPAGNTSNLTTDPFSSYLSDGAATELEVDTKLPTVTAFSPTANTVATVANGRVTFTVTFSENIKTSTLNATSVLVQRTGGTGSFATPVAVPVIAGSFTTSYSTAAATFGQETVTFAVAAPLPNDQYRVVLKGTGTTAITDIAGNPLDGQHTGAGSDYDSGSTVVFSASQSHLIYVQAAGSGIGIGTGTLGTRENPFASISAAVTAASVGDDVLVLPGTYQEDVTLRAGIRLLSAALSSTDTTFTPGSPYQTLIYGVPALTTGTGNIITVLVNGSTPGIPTEISGFSIISPLLGSSNLGFIDPTNVAIEAINSDAMIDRNIIINAGIGVNLGTSGANANTSQVFDNLIAGNINGVGISDNGATVSITRPFAIVNNTIVDNTTGLYNVSSTSNFTQANVVNNIFSSNHDLTAQRAGTGINSIGANTLSVGANLFFGNGPTNAPASNASGLFGLFNPAALSTTPDSMGNILGNPVFAQPEDPRPNGNTPAVFFTYGNFDLTRQSPAINAANNSVAPATDILYRAPVPIAGHANSLTGPASIGAYYFGGLGTNPGGTGIKFTGTGKGGGTGVGTGAGDGSGSGTGGGTGIIANQVSASSATAPAATVTNSTIGGGLALGTRQFGVLTTSLSNNGTVHAADATGVVASEAGPSYLDVNFSDDIKASSLSPTDLVLSGNGLDASNPARATSLAWIDDHAVRFFLSGHYNAAGTVNVSIPQGAVTDTGGAALVGFADRFQIAPTVSPSPAAPAPTVAPTTLIANVLPAVVQPIAAAAPVALLPAKAQHAMTAREIKQHAAAVKAEKAAEVKAAKVHAAATKAAQKAANKAKKAR